MPDPIGYLCPVLHAHLPYVRHAEYDDFLEERWFFDALTECYIPLIRVLEGLEKDGVEYHLLLSLSPTLVAMMEDPLLIERYHRHLLKLEALTEKELDRTQSLPAFSPVAHYYHNLIRDTLHWFEHRCQYRVALAFAKLASHGRLELMTCAATHGFLPLLRPNPASVRAQIKTAVHYHQEVFQVAPTGMWLPECAFYPDLDQVLAEAGICYFLVDSHALLHASTPPVHGVYAPVHCESGVAAFARDQESSKQVWSAEEGYPGHPDYREFYRDLGHELGEEYLAPILVDGKIRINTGLKYFRITGSAEKQPYNPATARQRAAEHAGQFLAARQAQVKRLRARMDRPPIAVAPYDAELFGHWWYEGPIFLDMLFRKIHFDQDVLGTITPALALQLLPTNQKTTPAASSWGHKGSYEFWMDDCNQWIYPLLHRAADDFSAAVSAHSHHNASSLSGRALRQAARELLLSQGSDWPFIMRTGTSPEYATRRLKDHLARFQHLLRMLTSGEVDELTLSAIEECSPLFQGINPLHFEKKSTD